MSAPDFSKLLSTNTDEIEKPLPLPNGTYQCQVTKFEYGETKSEKKTPFVLFTLTPIEPMEDVDSELLEGCLKGKPLNSKIIRNTMYITAESAYRVKDFVQKCGIDTSGRSLGEVIPETVGQVLNVSVTQRADTRPGSDAVFVEPTGFAAVE